jgi:hypothetical protein
MEKTQLRVGNNPTLGQQLNATHYPIIGKDGDKIVYKEEADNSWERWQYSKEGKLEFYENSKGETKDYTKEEIVVSMEEVAQKMGIPVERLRIKRD